MPFSYTEFCKCKLMYICVYLAVYIRLTVNEIACSIVHFILIMGSILKTSVYLSLSLFRTHLCSHLTCRSWRCGLTAGKYRRNRVRS